MKTQSHHRFAGASVLSSKLTMLASHSNKMQNKISISVTVCNVWKHLCYFLAETASTTTSTSMPARTTGITSTSSSGELIQI